VKLVASFSVKNVDGGRPPSHTGRRAPRARKPYPGATHWLQALVDCACNTCITLKADRSTELLHVEMTSVPGASSSIFSGSGRLCSATRGVHGRQYRLRKYKASVPARCVAGQGRDDEAQSSGVPNALKRAAAFGLSLLLTLGPLPHPSTAQVCMWSLRSVRDDCLSCMS
jgi:hypothetical protein